MAPAVPYRSHLGLLLVRNGAIKFPLIVVVIGSKILTDRPISNRLLAISWSKLSISADLSINKGPLILGAISKKQMSVAMSPILLNFPIIKLSLRIFDNDFAKGLTLDPICFDDLACRQKKLTFSMEFV